MIILLRVFCRTKWNCEIQRSIRFYRTLAFHLSTHKFFSRCTVKPNTAIFRQIVLTSISWLAGWWLFFLASRTSLLTVLGNLHYPLFFAFSQNVQHFFDVSAGISRS